MPTLLTWMRAAAATVALIAASTPTLAADPTPDATYDAADTWLCRPGRQDLCSADQTLLSIAADGSKSAVTLRADPNAPVDCFYIYPTISQDPNGNSSLKIGPGEQRAVNQQFAPFASACRTFAPMYRQITLAGLGRVRRNEGGVDRELAVEDVRAAWRHYLRNDNKGRGVVLVGHSQGTSMLIELLKRDIEGKPEQKLIVSALLPGINVLLPAGADTGGTFRTFAVCRRPDQTGCAVAFSTFRDTSPPPGNARFGRATTAGMEVACTDPAVLSGQPLRAMLVRSVNLLGQPGAQAGWQPMVTGSDAAFVDLPGMLKARCVKEGETSYYALTLDASARGNRAADIPGDIVVEGRLWDDWGLHLIDMNIAMGNLLELVKRQGTAWAARK
ncbi:MAG: DUF3089 domain-containing protein [Bdellovibrionales bacterium]|nr:DUF3089 domain-containing protein [Ramlibacter sp.]